MTEKTLNAVEIGKLCRVKRLILDEGEMRRMSDLGIYEGSEMTVLMQSIGGNPRAYSVRGSVIALRNESAKKIIVMQE